MKENEEKRSDGMEVGKMRGEEMGDLRASKASINFCTNLWWGEGRIKNCGW